MQHAAAGYARWPLTTCPLLERARFPGDIQEQLKRTGDPVGDTSDREHEIGPGTLRADVLERLEDARHQRAELVRLPRPEEKDSGVPSLAACPPAGDSVEVLCVPGDEHSSLGGGQLEHVFVRQTGAGGNLGDREDVVSGRRQLVTDTTRRKVLVEEKPHPLLPAYRGIPNER